MEIEKIYGLIGKSLNHSFSQRYFRSNFDLEGVRSDYLNYELNSIHEVEAVFNTPKLAGLNVTIPYKQKIIPFLDELSAEAATIGAVNTIQFKDGKKIGHNTDAFGFRQMIKPFLTNKHEKSLIFGTGGASKAVAYVLENIGIEVLYISRSAEKGDFTYADINERMIEFCGIIVNTTPVGTYPDVDDSLEIPFQALTSDHLVVDLIYNPSETKFLRKAKQFGATVLNGKTMLEQQAEAAWKIWNG